MENQISLHIDGLTCAHCAKGVEDHLKDLGLNDVRVNFASNNATFTSNSSIIVPDIIKSLNQIGFKAKLSSDQESVNKFNLGSVKFLTIFCSILALPLVLAKLLHIELLHNHILQMILTTPIMLSGGMYFTKSAIKSLRLKKPNMDVLIALGTWSAFFYSLYGSFFSLGENFLFYETSASIVAVVLIGNLIEARAIARTEDSLSKLQHLQPDLIRRLNSNNSEVENIKLDEIKIDDLILLSPGDKIPCDGNITEGSGELDESFLTGESLPRQVSKGDKVSSGGLVTGGNLVFKSTATPAESSLVRIIKSINQARAAKPSLERLADRITNYFVPTVLIFAILTFTINLLLNVALTESLLRAIAVLVIACPCALGLATPTAVTVALGLASRMGILVRKASVFEVLPKVQSFFFDKTGTLTDGKFRIERFEVNSADKIRAQQTILALEANSLHPIALALKNFCLAEGALDPIKLNELDERRGLGIFAKDTLGNNLELSSRDVESPWHLALRENNKTIAQIQLSDSIKPEAATLVKWLKNKGAELQILSGDSDLKTSQVSKELAIEKYVSKLLPDQKAEYVANAASSKNISFIGDGINDGAALARSNVGITFGTASDLARHSADVTIISGNLERIAQLIQLSERTTTSIKQNLFWAFFYNIIFIPFAAFGLLSPMHAALAMVLSDVIVVANSLRLRLWKPKPVCI